MRIPSFTLLMVVSAFLAVGICAAQTDSSGAATTSTSQSAVTTVPRLMKFSGVLTDAAGKALTGPVEVTFSIYKNQADVAPLWQETQTVQADAAGQYTVLLGAMSAQGLPIDLFTSGEARWLGVAAANLPEQPRVLLVSVPYALKAGDAETLGGKPASAYLLASQDQSGSGTTAGTGTSTSSTGKQATLTTATGIMPNAIVGNTNYIPVFTDDSGSMGNSLLYQSGSHVGLGTTTPSFAFDVNGNVLAVGTTTSNPGLGGTMRFRDDTGTPRWLSGLPGSVGATAFHIWDLVNSLEPLLLEAGTPSGTLYLNASGSVGIGTLAPTAKLEVNGTAKFDGLVTFASGQTFPGGTVTGSQTVQGSVTTSNQLVSTVATGTAPIAVTSTTLVPNLNADTLDGLHASAFLPVTGGTVSGPLLVGGPAAPGQNLVLEVQSSPGTDALKVDTDGKVTVGTSASPPHISQSSANTDFAGQITISSATSGNYSFATPFSVAPVCVATPTGDLGAVTWWVSPTATQVVVNLSAAATVTFNYVCVGNPS
jgi:hypothetical protein